jgi:hypothetical protein
MTFWLYTEEDASESDGPFFDLDRVSRSPLWDVPHVCLWCEARVSGGYYYRNAKRHDEGWGTTSRGLVPIPPFRPHFIDSSYEE